MASLSSSLVACSTDTEPERAAAPVAKARQAVWVNGDFEDSAIGTVPNGWTLSTYLNRQGGVTGVLGTPPTTFAALNLGVAGSGTALTVVVGGAAESQTDPSLGSSASLRLPKYGQRAVRVNNTGVGYNANSLTQTMTASLGDVDPLDDKVHVRFAVAPVLNNPSHPYAQQPYYFVQLRNVTRNTTLYTDFNVSAQEGVPWKSVGSSLLYTDWQLVDIAPGNASLAVGDDVQLTVVASNCAQGGSDHFARLYVDAVGSGIPGLYSWATGPQSANSGDNITYTLNYKNGGTTSTTGTTVEFVTPPNTTFQSVNYGGVCTTPAAGAAGTVSCTVGALSPGGVGAFTATVKVNAGATGSITNGNYSIAATGVSALVGPKVITSLTSGVSYTDVGVAMSDGKAALGWGQSTRYTAVVTNKGALDASSVTVTDTFAAQLTGVQWTCTASAGSTCGAASGSGSISHTGSLKAGGTFTYQIDANVIAGNGSGSVVNTMAVSIAGGLVDPDSSNNSAVDTNAIGTLRSLTVNKPGLAAAGSINTTPASIACGTTCSTATAQFLEGSQVVLTAAPSAGATFVGWSGACSGNATTCTITVGADTTVGAAFAGAPAAVAVSAGSSQTATVGTAFAASLAALVTDAGGTPVPGTSVSFAAPGAGASATLGAASATTNAAGIASVSATAKTLAGAYAATASVNGIALPASFSLTNRAGAATSMQIAASQSQSAKVHTAFAAPLEVTLKDTYGNLVSGASVGFTAPAAGATSTLSGASATSDASGKASITATAGSTTGLYDVQAAVAGGPSNVFHLTNTAGDPATLHLVSGNAQDATVAQAFAQSLKVRVEDADGNLVPSASISFRSPAAGASAQLSASTASSDANGLASVSAQANTTAGAYAIVAEVANGQSAVSFAMSNHAAAPASIVASALSAQQAAAAGTPYARSLEATVYDAYDNPVPNANVTFSVPSEGSTAILGAASASSDASGKVSVAAIAGTTLGSFAAEAHTAGVAQPASFALSVLAAAPSELVASAGAGQSATVLDTFANQLTVRVLDAFGNPVVGVALDLQLPSEGASASLPPGPYVTDANGEVQLQLTANSVAGSFELIASIPEGAAPIAFSLHNDAGAVAGMQADLGSTPQATVVSTGFSAPLAVRVVDAHGNPVAGKNVHFAAPEGSVGADLSAADAVTDENGMASIAAMASAQAGSYVIVATVEGLATQVEFALANVADAPANAALLSGGGQSTRATTSFAAPLVVRLADSHDNPIGDVELTLAAPTTGTSVTGPSTARTAADGTASFALTANAIPGTAQLAITTAGLAAPLVIEVRVDAIATSVGVHLDSNVFFAGDSQQLQLSVRSEVGAPTGTIAIMEGSRRLGEATLSDGAASFPLLFAEPGQHTLMAVFSAEGAYAGSRSLSFVVAVNAKPSIDDDHDHGSSSGGSSGGAASSGGASSGGASSGAPNGAANDDGSTADLGTMLSGGSGCSVGAAPSAGFSSLVLGLVAMLTLRRRARRS